MLATQNTQNAIAFGVGVLLHPEGTQTNFTATGGEMTRKVEFAFDDDGALVVKFVNDHKPAIAFIGANDAPFRCGPGSKLKQSWTPRRRSSGLAPSPISVRRTTRAKRGRMIST